MRIMLGSLALVFGDALVMRRVPSMCHLRTTTVQPYGAGSYRKADRTHANAQISRVLAQRGPIVESSAT